MLRFLTGLAGTGKSTRLLLEIKRTVEEGRRAVLIVPEQFSFEGEQRVYELLGPQASLSVEVLSFTRLCNMVFRQFGGLAGIPITDAGRILLMSLALEELRGELQVYRKSSRNPAFLQTMTAACGELKAAGVNPSQLQQFAEECETGALKDKLTDLSLLYTAYQGLLDQGYADPEDSLIRACELLENNDFFAGLDVYVDGFTTFLAAEFEMLGHIIRQAESLTLAMTADEGSDRDQGVGVFSPVKQAMDRLERMANQAGVVVEERIHCRESLRYHNPMLMHLSRHFFQLPTVSYEGTAENLQLIPCANDYEQAAEVAAGINELVRNGECRYRDIAVVARDTTRFVDPLAMMLERDGIPYFADRRRDVENTPLVFGLFAALDALRDNFHPVSMLLLAKSPILGLDPEEVALLENYCFIWDIRGRLWQSEFHNNPRGMVEGFTEEDVETLMLLNRLRETLISPLLRLRTSLREGAGRSFAEGIYAFLVEIEAGAHLTAFAESLPEGESLPVLEESTRVWDAVMDVLDLFGDILEERKLPWRRLADLFRLAVSATDVGSIPQTLDQVLVGGADRIRPGAVKAVFVVGANEGIFPKNPGFGGVFSDDEREQLIRGGIGVSAPGVSQAALERFFAYFSLTLPSDSLTVLWSRTALDSGAEVLPSVIVEELERLFPLREKRVEHPLRHLGGGHSARALLAAHYREDSALTASLIRLFEDRGEGGTVERMEQLSRQRTHMLHNRRRTRALFGRDLRLSPSSVERYHRCSFAYFMRDGMRLHKRRRAAYSPLESGNVIHHVLQAMVQKYGGKGLNTLQEDAIRAEVEELIGEYLSGRIEDLNAMPMRMRYLFRRLCETLTSLLQRLGREFEQSLFQPAAFELEIREGEEVEPLYLKTPDGVSVRVEGIVDRVDVMEKNGRKYVRVVDYKSGGRSFRLEDVVHGLNLQMLLYLFTLQEQKQGVWQGAIPAGVLYMPVSERYVRSSRDADPARVKRERERRLCMDGLLLDDPEILAGMEQELSGIFIPARKGKDGGMDARSSVASPAQLGSIARKVQGLLRDMAEAVTGGAIAALPVMSDDFNPCEYCEYRAACGFEPDDPVREIARMDQEAIYKMLEREEGEDGGEALDQAATASH